MNRYCVEKWQNNKHLLEKALNEHPDLENICYADLMNLCVEHILNVGVNEHSSNLYRKEVVVADPCDFSGELFFVIVPEYGFGDFLVSYTDYGSCTVCDALQRISYEFAEEKTMTREEAVKDFMLICKDMVCNIVKPYNEGWRHDARFDTIEVEL